MDVCLGQFEAEALWRRSAKQFPVAKNDAENSGEGTGATCQFANISIDAYRGFVMLLMMAEVLQLSRVAAAYPTSFFLENPGV